MRRSSLSFLGCLSALTSAACISVLGSFEVGGCPAGQTAVAGQCVTPAADGGGTTAGTTTSPNPIATTCADPGAPTCGPKQECSDTGGSPTCVCKAGLEGQDCSACAAGLQDNDGNGTCEATCATAGLTCVEHARCADQGGTAECRCTVGFSLDGEGQCVFTGGPKDPEFLNASSPWIATQSTIEPAAAGEGANVGVVRMAACDKWGTLAQTFDMPSPLEREPLALKVRSRGLCLGDGGTCYGGPVFFNTSVTREQLSVNYNTWATTSTCLGERAYGPGVSLLLYGFQSPPGYYFCSGAAAGSRELQLDMVSIVPDASCPAPRTLVNPDFEANGGWTATNAADVAAGVGSAGSRGGRLHPTTKCTQVPTLEGSASFPSPNLPNAALAFTYKGPNGKVAELTMSGWQAGPRIVGSGVYNDVTVCVPEFAKGYVGKVRVGSYPLVGTTLPPGEACADADDREYIFDDFRFVSAPDKCPQVASIVDGDFERTDPGSPWRFAVNGATSFVTTGANAKSGTRYLYLAGNRACRSALATATITIPQPNAAGGPVLRFSYRLTTAANVTYSATAAGVVKTFTTNTPASTWVDEKICLPPDKVGEPANLQFEADNTLTSATATCDAAVSGGFFYVDAVSVGTDASCPSTPP